MARSARHIAGTLVAAFAVLAAAAAALAWWAGSEGALHWVAQELAAASGGRVSVSGARGSLAGALAFDRVTYKDAAVEVVASGVALEWMPAALIARRVSIATLSAEDVEITLLPSTTRATLPGSLALPLALAIDRLRVSRLVVRSGGNRHAYAGIEAGYAGDAARHAITSLALNSDFGRVGGDLSLAAARPYTLGGNIDWSLGEGAWRTHAHATLAGTLERISGTLKGGVGALPLEGSAVLALLDDSWLPELVLAARGANLAAVDAALPRTALSGALKAGTDAKGRLAGTLALDNTAAGTWTDQRLPVSSLAARVAVIDGGVRFDDLRGTLGAGGRIGGSGRVTGAGTEWDLALADVDLRAIHKPLRATSLDGRVKAALAGDRQTFDASLSERRLTLAVSAVKHGERIELRALHAKAGKGELSGRGELSLSGAQPYTVSATFSRFDPSDFGDFAAAQISGEAGATGDLAPAWRAEARFALKDSSFRGAPLAGSGAFKLTARGARDAAVDLRVGANRLQVKGSFGAQGDALDFEFDGARLAQLDPRFAGKLAARGSLGGTGERPALTFDASGEALAFGKHYAAAALDAHGLLSADADPRIEIKARGSKLAVGGVGIDAFAGSVTGTLENHGINVNAAAPGTDFTAALEGGLRAGRLWSGRVVSLANRGRLPFALLAPASLEAGPGRLAVGAAAAEVLGGRLALRSLNWENGRLESAGGFTGMPAAPLLALAGVPPAPGSDLTLRGAWAIAATPRLNGTLTLAREAGDLVVLRDPALPLGIERLELDLKFVEDAARAALALRGKQVGDAAAEVTVVPPAGADPLAPQSALAGSARLDLSTLRLLDEWIGTAALVDGTARARLALAGTLAKPLVTGTLEGDRLSIEVPQQGIALKNGRLRAELTDSSLVMKEFAISGPSGTLSATGRLARADSGAESQVAWRADALRLLDRPDRRLTVAGSGTVAMSGTRMEVRGELKALDGYIEFERPRTTELGDDVVVVGRDAKAAPRARRRSALDFDASFDFGDRFRIAGAGLETGLRGRLRVHTSAEGALLAAGRVRAVNGTYLAFGQKLVIERGQLYFDGPIDNPGLDLVAMRKNLQVEAGVEVTGTVRAPRVRLISEPPVPDGEKLAWLVTGRGLDSTSGADIGLLQAAASTLVNSNEAVPLTRRVARQVGLDDIGVRGGGGSGSTGSTGSTLGGEVLSVGKRLSDGLYLEYEQGLAVASSVLRLNYQLTRALSLRVESGTASAFGLFYRRSYD